MNSLEVVYLSCLNFNGLIWGKGTNNPHLPVPCRGHKETAEECALWLEKDTKVKCTPLVHIVTRIVVTRGGVTGEIRARVTFTKGQRLGTISPTYTLIFPDSGHLPSANLPSVPKWFRDQAEVWPGLVCGCSLSSRSGHALQREKSQARRRGLWLPMIFDLLPMPFINPLCKSI